MLIKIFENSFSERDSRLVYLKKRMSFQKITIQQNVTKYRSHGMSLNRNKENSGRQRAALFEENIKLLY